jgi:hypothetical protein
MTTSDISWECTYLNYGTVTFSRVISDGNHGNVKAERSISILIPPGAGPSNIAEVTTEAWIEAMDSVFETINQAFEAQGLPAPYLPGDQIGYILQRWSPDLSILLLIPFGSHHRVPGETSPYWFGEQSGPRRLDDAQRQARRIVAFDSKITDYWDFSDGDFEELQILADQYKEAEADAIDFVDPEIAF